MIATGIQTGYGGEKSLNYSGLASGLELKKRNGAVSNTQLPGENDHLTFELPPEPPKDKKKKKGKKGKKGSGKKKKRK